MLLFAVRACQRTKEYQIQQQLQQKQIDMEMESRQKEEQEMQLQREQLEMAQAKINEYIEQCELKILQVKEENQKALVAAEIFMDKMEGVRTLLEADSLACDAKWTLFVAATMSYRYESLLDPCPPDHQTPDDELALMKIYEAISELPSFDLVLQNIIERTFAKSQLRSMNLLHWLLVEGQDTLLHTVRPEEYDTLPWSEMIPTMTDWPPKHLFEITASKLDTPLNNALSKEFPVKIVFYGGCLEEFYCLVNSDEFPDDQPIMVSTNLSNALKRSPTSPGWGGSSCGSFIRCVAVCEILCNPNCVHKVLNIEDAYAGIENENQDLLILSKNHIVVRHLMFFAGDRDDYGLSASTVYCRNAIKNARDKLKKEAAKIKLWFEKHDKGYSLPTYLAVSAMSAFVWKVGFTMCSR